MDIRCLTVFALRILILLGFVEFPFNSLGEIEPDALDESYNSERRSISYSY